MLGGIFLFQAPHPTDEQKIRAAREVLRGRVTSTLTGPYEAKFPFDERELLKGSSTDQLHRAMMMPTSLLLDAYGATQDLEYLIAARDTVAAWADYEARVVWSRGLLWNDHAIAERAIAIGRFWMVYRQSAIYDAEIGAKTLRFARRSADFLASAQHFTARSNHGVMQSLALLYLARAFPTLPRSGEYADIAVARIDRQLEFYVSEEGAVLEHSPYYHQLGVKLLEYIEQLRRVAGRPITPALASKAAKSRALLAALMRTDQSLPLIGNTPEKAPRATLGLAASYESLVLPISGTAVSWHRSGKAPTTQLVMTWANFATRAHKHANDGSVALWSGREIITNSGYWPYDDARLMAATGWRGSNAPHLVGEAATIERANSLLAYAETDATAYFDVESARRGGTALRRQVLWIKPTTLLIIDSSLASSPAPALETLWTVHHSLKATESLPIAVSASDGMLVACLSLPAGNSYQVRRWFANSDPFGGFFALGADVDDIMPTHTIELRSNAKQPLLSMWSLAPPGGCDASTLELASWAGSNAWTVNVAHAGERLRVTRNGSELVLTRTAGDAQALHLAPQDAKAQEIARSQIDAAYRALAAEYPPTRYLRPWRVASSYAVIAGVLAQLAIFASLRWLWRTRAWGKRLAHFAGWPVVAAWLAACSWLVFFYIG